MPASDQGVNLERYMLIPRTLIFLTRGENILLIKGAPDKRLWANLYNGIGGHVELGEDILTAARREIQEETKLHIDDLWLCAVVTINTSQNPGIVLFIFRGECSEGEPLSSGEGNLEWVPYQEIDTLPLVEDLPSILEHIMPMRVGQPPLAAHYYYTKDGKMSISYSD